MCKLNSILAVFSLLFVLACSSGETENSSAPVQKVPSTAPTAPTAKTDNSAEAVPVADNQTVLSWVEKLNIREEPNTKSKVVAQAKENDRLTLTGDKSDKKETLELRGKSYTEPWVKVKTADGKTGWVFGGAVKKAGEAKGNALNTKTKFTYPYFGSFDLSEWKKISSTRPDDESDVSVNSTTYQKGSQFLQIDIADSNYYWMKTMKLMDSNKKVIQERTLNIEPGNEEGTFNLTETVNDFSSSKQYARSEVSKQSWFKYKPDMLKGDWKVTSMKGAKTSNTSTGSTSKKIISEVSFVDCANRAGKDFDCSCVFREGDPYKGTPLFVSDLDEKACIQINGEMNSLYPDWEEKDYKAALKKLAASKTWINVRDSEITYFGKSLADHKYDNAVDLLTDVILASGKKMTAIPIVSTATGMAIREVRDEANEAIAKANSYFTKGGKDPLTIYKYDNRSYDVIVRVRKTTNLETEVNAQEGTITLLKNRRTGILETRAVKGTCGC